MATAAETILEGGPMSIRQVMKENARLRSAISESIERLESIHDGDGLDVEFRIAEVRDNLAKVMGWDAAQIVIAPFGKRPPTLDELELGHIQSVLRKHFGDKRATALELGISLKTLYNKLSRIEAMGDHAAV